MDYSIHSQSLHLYGQIKKHDWEFYLGKIYEFEPSGGGRYSIYFLPTVHFLRTGAAWELKFLFLMFEMGFDFSIDT